MAATTLTPETIIEAARRMIGGDGLDGFSMRKLAASLDVNPMTIYLRFDNKHELLAAVAERALHGLELPAPAGSWDEQVVGLVVALRDHLVRDRELLRLLDDAARLGLGLLDGLERGLALLEEGGLPPAEAVASFRVLFWHAVGGALVAAQFPTLPAGDVDLPVLLAGSDPSRYPKVVAAADRFGPIDGDAPFLAATRALVAGLGRHPTVKDST